MDDDYLKVLGSQNITFKNSHSIKLEKDSREQQNHQPKPEDLIKTEIEQLPSALAKANFSQEEITESLKQYKLILEQLPEKYLLKLNEGAGANQQNILKNLFIKKVNMPIDIADILSKVNYDGQLIDILRDETKRKEFFEQLDRVIEPEKEQQIADTEVQQGIKNGQVSEEVLDASAAIEAQKGHESATLDSPTQNIPTTPEEHIQETVTSYEQEALEEASQNMALVQQDNSFLGKIKRVFANMRDMKNKDNSKGFFVRLGTSIKNVFGNKKEEFYAEQDEISIYAKTEDKIQLTTNPQQIDYLNQHFEVNTQEAIKKTEESKKAKEFLSTEDKTSDKEEK